MESWNRTANGLKIPYGGYNVRVITAIIETVTRAAAGNENTAAAKIRKLSDREKATIGRVEYVRRL